MNMSLLDLLIEHPIFSTPYPKRQIIDVEYEDISVDNKQKEDNKSGTLELLEAEELN